MDNIDVQRRERKILKVIIIIVLILLVYRNRVTIRHWDPGIIQAVLVAELILLVYLNRGVYSFAALKYALFGDPRNLLILQNLWQDWTYMG